MLEIVDKMTPDIYRALQRAVEIGKWPDGANLTRQQRETCMQATLLYESRHFEGEPVTGVIDADSKKGSHCEHPGDEDVIAKIRMH